ncbi:hypothetical protein M409DRAFT_51366 [Zasmidium cellare ATCC 36951]|uniref:Uncharacterized protein n=1 Tax=Zasmidium cellare ATCC 36951 TaxID=1080233 RepID=A0A6A6CVE9_ZASCE|nr:uncharacterized protein M409DRAFT_51366 [Zasmidium cellare ATCC 36951]KAF2171157.1 hypothetical protein M409DRAFT_51366 [Zasmidium cellare ATCC 36951]
MDPTKRTVLITGCSSGGIGAALAIEYHQRGYHVFATTRNTKKIPTSLTSLPSVTALALDVTSPQSIEAAVKEVSEITGGRLDVLVNNSGAALTAPALDTDVEQARGVFEVNVLGVLAVTKAFTPLLVRAKDACIVNNSSINGETNLPFSAIYGASKAATTALSETLRLEVAPLGIRVVTVITGIIETNLHDNEPEHPLPSGSYYKPVESWLQDRISGKNRPPGMPVEEFAKQLVRKCEGGAKGKVYVGPLTPLFVYLKWWMPSFVWDYFMLQSGPKNFGEVALAVKRKQQ